MPKIALQRDDHHRGNAGGKQRQKSGERQREFRIRPVRILHRILESGALRSSRQSKDPHGAPRVIVQHGVADWLLDTRVLTPKECPEREAIHDRTSPGRAAELNWRTG